MSVLIFGFGRSVIPENSRPWSDFTLMLLTPEDLLKLPNGTIVIDIFGKPCIKTEDIDTETRCGMTAYGFLREKEGENRDYADKSLD